MLVLGDESIAFNRLRAVFAMQIRPPFGFTDYVGDYAISGFPRLDADGGIVSANDDVDNPDQGNLEFDYSAQAIYPRAQFVLHDNDFAENGATGDAGKTGNALILWHDGSANPSVAYGSILPGSGTSSGSSNSSSTATDTTTDTAGNPATGYELNGTGGGASGSTTGGGKVVQGPFARTQVRAPGFTSMQLSVGQASEVPLNDCYSETYGKSTPVYGDFRIYGDVSGVGGCQGFTGFLRLFPPADGAINPPPDKTTGTPSTGSGSGSSSSGSSSSSSSSSSGGGGSSNPETTTIFNPGPNGTSGWGTGFHNYRITKMWSVAEGFHATPNFNFATWQACCSIIRRVVDAFYVVPPSPSAIASINDTTSDVPMFAPCTNLTYGPDDYQPPAAIAGAYIIDACYTNSGGGSGSAGGGANMNAFGFSTGGETSSGGSNGSGGDATAAPADGVQTASASASASGGGEGETGASGGGEGEEDGIGGQAGEAGEATPTGAGAAQTGASTVGEGGTPASTGISTETGTSTGGTTQTTQTTGTESSTGSSTGTTGSTGTSTGTTTGSSGGGGSSGSSGSSGASGGLSLVGGGGLVSHTMLAFRLVGSGRAAMRWYAISWEIGGMVTLCYNDALDNSGNPLDSGWVVADKLKMGEGRDAVLEPDAANTYVMGPTENDWTIGLQGENFPGKITSGMPVPGKPHTEEKLPKLHVAEVRVIGGQIRAHIGEEQTPFMWPAPETGDSGVPDWFIDRFMVLGSDVYGAEWSAHPTKFATSAALISNPINLGFVPDSGQLARIQYRTHYTPDFKSDAQVANAAQVGFRPDGSSATCETYANYDTELRYKLTFTNPPSGKTYRGLPYAHATSAVQSVGLDIPGTEWSLISPPTILGSQDAPPKPEGIDVFHQFDVGSLSIQSRAVLTFNNYSGLWTNGEGTGIIDTKGHFAVGIELGTNASDVLNREFTGIANTDFQNSWGGGGKDKVTISCADCWTFLDVPVWNLPWFDGFNVYYVMAYLAELGTITRGQMAFADLIPENPYGRSPGLPDDEQYFLGSGPAGTPLTRFGSGETLKNIMLKISRTLGFALFFDVYGHLNFFKFRVAPPSGFVRTFSHVPGDAENPGQWGTDEIWAGGSYGGGLTDTKNSVTVIGINALGPLWNPLVAHRADFDSVFDDSVPNYKGFHDAVVWTDNLFADIDFADSAATSMLEFLRLPDRQVNFSTWYPVGGKPVYPGDLIRIRYPRSGASMHTYFVVATHAARHQGQLPRLDISARLIPTP